MKLTKSHSPKELYVRVSSQPPIQKNYEFNLSKLKEEYDGEVSEIRSWNIFSGGGIGASIGLIACLTSTLVGVPLSSVEAFTIVGGSLFIGLIAGFILY